MELLGYLEMEALLDLLLHRALLPEFTRDASHTERDELLLRKPGILNGALASRLGPRGLLGSLALHPS
jgi:hypothetical protein